MTELEAVPAYRDNYIWVIHDGRAAVLVDPGEAGPILAWLARRQISPVAILATHHHADHVDGIPAITARWDIPIHGPARPEIPGPVRPVGEGDSVAVPELGLEFAVLATPGHTRDHVCYLGEGRLFCGDTLFSCGCGRLFEGTPGQMHASLERLARLPGDTRVCCAHEYTLANIAFAQELEPNAPALIAWQGEALRLRQAGRPTLPSTLGRERQVNPFLRCAEPAQVKAAGRHLGAAVQPGAATFAALRAWKDRF